MNSFKFLNSNPNETNSAAERVPVYQPDLEATLSRGVYTESLSPNTKHPQPTNTGLLELNLNDHDMDMQQIILFWNFGNFIFLHSNPLITNVARRYRLCCIWDICHDGWGS